MPNKWISHVKAYHAAHPHLTYRQAMKEARPSYKKGGSMVIEKPPGRIGVVKLNGSGRGRGKKHMKGGDANSGSDMFENLLSIGAKL